MLICENCGHADKQQLANKDAQIAVLTEALADGVSCHPSAHQNNDLITRRLSGNLGIEERLSLLALLTMRAALTPDLVVQAARYRETTRLLIDIRDLMETLGKSRTWGGDSASVRVSIMNVARHISDRIAASVP